VLWIAAATGAFLVPLFLIFFFVLNNFYDRGANLHDSGFFAHLIWHGDWNLTNPSFLWKAHDLRRSFLAIHISPILWPASAVSYILRLDRVQIFALYLGASHALLGIFMYCILTRWWIASSALEILCAALLAIAFSINGLAVQIAYFPHIEIAIPGLLLGTLYFLLSCRTAAAAIFLCLALAVREDAGFHFFGFASLLIVCNLLRGVPLNRQRTLVVFLIIAVCYSCAAILIQRAFFPEYPGSSTFVRTYSGVPAFAHVTRELLMERLSYYAAHRAYIWGPLMITIGLFVWTRNLYFLVGVGAVLPWLILQTVAVSEAPGRLFAYYAFPFMLTLAWPPFAIALSSQGRVSHWGLWRVMAIMATIIGVSFAPPVRPLNFLRDCIPTRIALDPDPIRKFMAALKERASAAYFLTADTSVIALAPDEFDRGAFLEPEPASDAGMLAFFRHGPEHEEAYSQMIFMNDLHTYNVPQTNVWLATAGPLSAESELANIVRPLSSLEVFQIVHFGRLGPNGLHLGAQDPKGIALFGPFVRVPAGRYEVRYALLVNHLPASGGELRIDVADSHGQRVLATYAQSLHPNDRQISLPFSVPEGGSADLEVRYWHDGLSDVTVQGVSIYRKDAEDLLPALVKESPSADIPAGVWEERENGWSGVWTPRPGETNIFDAVWTQGTHKITAELSMKRSGNVITIARSRASDNINLTYVGLITGRKVSGRYPGGRWSAEIRVAEQ
jgi:hypothetical protein